MHFAPSFADAFGSQLRHIMFHKKIARASTRGALILSLCAALFGCDSDAPPSAALPDGVLLSGPHSESKNVAQGAAVKMDASLPQLSLTTLEGKTIDSRSFRGTPTLLMFADTTCPCVKAYDERISALQKEFNGLRVIYIFSDARETPAQIKRFVQARGYDFPIIRDASQKLLKQFDAQCTTETFLIDRAGTLRYHGRIDDNIFVPASVKSRDLENALTALRDGKAVPAKETRAFACTIPRVAKRGAAGKAA
jgi:peroxiredoxin